jgi:DASH complex subunit Spc34
MQKPNSPVPRFPAPKIFTNAILGNHEITTLIRDTEPHERALFSIDPNARVLPTQRRSNRRTTTFASDENRAPTSFNAIPRKQSVARMLGPDMLQEIEGYRGNATKRKMGSAGPVDIEMLLRGAEKLCGV